MTYQITGIDPDQIDTTSAYARAVHVQASSDYGFPCRVTLQDAPEGEDLILFHYASHEVDSPYRNSYAIYVRSLAKKPAQYTDEIPPVFNGRPLGMRGFGSDAMLKTASLSMPGDADQTIRELFEQDEVAYIDVHNAAHGCFVARVKRYES